MPVFAIKSSIDARNETKIIELQGNLEATASSLEDIEIGILGNNSNVRLIRIFSFYKI
jgi:hypothetical protein